MPVGPGVAAARGAVRLAGAGTLVAGFDELLQDVIGLGVMAEAVQHPQDVSVGVTQLQKTLHFALLPIHGSLRVCVCVCVSLTVWFVSVSVSLCVCSLIKSLGVCVYLCVCVCVV